MASLTKPSVVDGERATKYLSHWLSLTSSYLENWTSRVKKQQLNFNESNFMKQTILPAWAYQSQELIILSQSNCFSMTIITVSPVIEP